MDIKRNTTLRWIAPIAIAATVAAGSFVAANPASADPNLEPRTAEQLMSDVASANVNAFSGTFSQTANLGLPDLGALSQGEGDEGSDGGVGIQQFLSGTTTARVWQSGESSRISLPDGVNETSVYTNGDAGWIWSSKELTATKFDASGHEPKTKKTDSTMTPAEAARKILAETEKDSTVTTTRGGTVAGRAAYELVVTPKQAASLVDRVEIAVDGETKMPLQVEVYADGVRDPAAEIGFSAISFETPDASVFNFTPPPGAKVEQAKGHDKADKPTKADKKRMAEAKAESDVKTVGDGWATVKVAKLGKDAADTQDPQAQQVLNTLPKVSGDWGTGRLFEGPLFSAVLTDDGRVAMGAVAPELLYSALK